MEALILSCSTGGGHNSAAKAIQSELNNRGWTTHFFDPYSLRSQKMADRIGNAYVSTVRFSPAIFGDVYTIGELYEKAERTFHLPDPVLMVQKKSALVLYRWLKANPVDIVICTHPYPGLMLTWLKKAGYILPPTIMVPTDYTCIPFESDVMTDWMTLPWPGLARLFFRHGVQYARQIPTGIPIDPGFARPVSKKAAALALGLDEKQRYILIGGGSMGINGIWDILARIRPIMQDHPDLHVLVLCGTNKALARKIRALDNPAIDPVGFTTRMHEYLSVASLYITKPGGLSITEAAACQTPLLLTSAIPGCETRNAQLFEKQGWARYARSLAEVPVLTRVLLESKPDPKASYPQWFGHTAARLADWVECAVCLNPSQLKSASSRAEH